MFNAHERSLIAQLSPRAQQLAQDPKHFSYFENYCDACQLPDLEPGTAVDWCEFYYGNDSEPAVFFSNGSLASINLDNVSDSKTFQILGSDGTLFIQVDGEVILHRAKDAILPDWNNMNLAAQLSAFTTA